MKFWRTLVGKLWITITLLVACVLLTLGLFLLPYIDTVFNSSNSGDIKRLFTYVSIIGFAMTTFFGLFLLTKITQPMQKLIEAANAIRRGRYDTRLKLVTSDEIGELANTFNHMAAELETTIRSLNHEKEHLSSVLRSMSDAVITFDNNGDVILANPPGRQVMENWQGLKWDKDLEGGGWAAEVMPEPLIALFNKTMREGRDQMADLHVKQGVWEAHMAPLYSDDIKRGAVAVLRDITEQVKLEKMRTDFIANVSHEIRTPLSMMQGYSEALLDGMAASPEESRELIQVIHEESLRMGRLVKDLLDLTRMEAGHAELDLQKVDAGELCERVTRKFAVRAKEQDIELTLYKRSQNLLLNAADEDKLEQVLTNLLDNAIRHTPSGKGISITLERISLTGSAAAIQFEVSDQGVGIPSADVPFVFDRFYKADKARVRGETVGTGIGLAIVKNIVEAHKGQITVDSVVGEGTRFTFVIPD
ncbi:HAMP domain-containing protein [Paenibacillus sp. F411]|uniref:histidine kinase n=1 Tax=Paenibacillus algicola TaxID=2565926 RepID=A0A4P8XIT6_9BACL|nr:ATP-binding protein [Paenibacillus algicola]MBO2945055.1 HAMP domain-containing protein [Paenibacillus sp. F411]QCT02527.1 multi-sensor signal transduction histidine kinase [Paenibacillus algicola]